MTHPKRLLYTLLAAATFLTGWAASLQARDVETSGFLGQDYELLRPGQEGEALLVYRYPEACRTSYDKIKRQTDG